MRRPAIFTVLFALLLCACRPLAASIRLPHILSDHAVLQRDRPIHLWGWSTPGVSVTARFRTETVSTQSNSLGEWSLYLPPQGPGGPDTLRLSGDGPDVVLTDLLVGDVWLASGQSNMEFPLGGFAGAPLKDGAREIAASTHPRIRLLRLEQHSSDLPLNDQPNSWTLCEPATAEKFSAVAYFFGREIVARQDVPIGLIDSSWGGTPAEPWLSFHAYADPALSPSWASWAAFVERQKNVDDLLRQEKEQDAAAAAAGRPKPAHPWHPFAPSWQPAGLFNGMIAPLTPYSLRGFLWYQGETNSAPDRAPHYATLLRALIADWRERFAQGELPFLYAQISSFASPEERWGLLRDEQRRVLNVAGTAMAVTLDLGEAANVHPPDKQTVGKRLALAAGHVVYRENLPWSGPLYRQTTSACTVAECTLRVWFDHAEGGLHATAGTPLDSFEIAGPDRHFVPAEARIDGATVVVSSPAVPSPAYVRFGWNSVVTSNLFNAAGLPASTFTSEPGDTP